VRLMDKECVTGLKGTVCVSRTSVSVCVASVCVSTSVSVCVRTGAYGLRMSNGVLGRGSVCACVGVCAVLRCNCSMCGVCVVFAAFCVRVRVRILFSLARRFIFRTRLALVFDVCVRVCCVCVRVCVCVCVFGVVFSNSLLMCGEVVLSRVVPLLFTFITGPTGDSGGSMFCKSIVGC